MKLILILAWLQAVLATTQPAVMWFEQNIDHFNFQNNGTFQQRYLYNDEYFSGDGPLFFYTGNEGTIWDFYNNSGFVFELAEKFGALVDAFSPAGCLCGASVLW